MAKARRIDLRVSPNEYERICNSARAKNHPTLSSYLRSVVLRDDLFIESKIIETNTVVKEILRIMSQK
jgi:hypothetical protein